jgi:hypothetical protein
MCTYGITHAAGNYQVILIEMNSGFSAHIFDVSSKCITVLHAKDEDATYYACLNWASANIQGEFQFM